MSRGRAGSALGVERSSGAIWRTDWREIGGWEKLVLHRYLLNVTGTQL